MAEPQIYEWDGKEYVPSKGTPGARTIYWDGYQWIPGQNPEGPNAFMRGLATAWEGIKDIPAVGYAMAQGALGDEQGSKDTLGAIKEKTEQNLAGGYQTRYTLEDVKKDPTKLGGWAAEQMGGAAASIGFGVAAALATGAALPAVGAGAVGTVATGAAARFGLGRMAAAAVQRGQAAALAEAAQTGTAITAEQAAAQAIQGIGRTVAMTGAVGLASGAQNIPESFTTIFDETGQIRPGVAFSVGALKSSLDVLPITRLMARTRGPEFADRLTNLISARLASKYPGATGALAGSLESLAYEGLTEGAQALLDQTAMNIIADKSIDWENVLENAAGGGVGSMPFGAAAGFLGGRRARARGPRPAQETTPPGETPPGTTGEITPPPPITPTGEGAITPAGEGAPTVTPTGEVVPGGEAAPTVTPAGEGAPAVTPAGEAAPTDLDRLRAALPLPGAEGIRKIMGAKWASDTLGREVTPDEARQFFGELQKEGRVVPRGPGFMVPFKEVPLIDHLTSVVDSNEERHGQRFITIDQLRENLPEGDLAQMQDIVSQLGSQGVQITESAPAAGRVPALQQRLDEVLPQYKGQPAAGVFQTEKGSIYLTHDDGTTTRHKEARADVGHEGDFGWKERTQKTVYVDPLMVGALSAAGLEGVGSRGARLLLKDGKATLALWNDASNKWGVTRSLANVPVYDKPAPGLAPLELWNKKDDVPAGFEGYASQHAGNKIVAMGPAPAIAPTEVTPTAEVTPAAEITPPAAQPDAVATLENISEAYKSLAGTDWQSYRGGLGPTVLVANLLKSIRASNPQYTQEDLARDLHLVDRNPDLLTKDGASISFLFSTVAKERKAKPVIFKDAQGRSFPYYAIRFVKADQYALFADVEATTDNYHPSVRAPEDPASMMGARDLRVQFTSDVRRLLKKWDEERNTGLLIHDLIRLNNNLQQRAETRKEKRWAERVRGELYIRERLLREERDGTIPTELRQLVEWLIKQNPAIVQDLGISVREGPEGERGRYNPANRVITLFRHAANPLTGVHEILHHTERMMPDDVRAGIRGEWLKRLEREHMQAARRGDKAALDFFDMVMERNLAGKALSPETFAKFMREQNLSRDYYQYVNPSEFWAENASTLVRERSKEGWVGKATRWLKGLAETVKKALGMRSDAPIMRALDDILAGRGKPAGKMLADLNIFPAPIVEPVRAPREPQSVTSADTSLNQIPALFKSKVFKAPEGGRNLDIGGGRYDLGTRYLKDERGVSSSVLDPYNRTDAHNDKVRADFERNPADTVTVANVLNVIKEDTAREQVVADANKYLRPGGTAYFQIYEGNKSGKGVRTPKGYQNNRVTQDYLNEIRKHFPDAYRKDNIIVATKPAEAPIVEPVRTPAVVAADVQQFQAINEQANTMLDEVSIPFSCRVKK